MRTDSTQFALQNQAASKRPRYVIELSFDDDNTILWYFTSHSDAAVPNGASVIHNVVEGMSGTSQQLNPDTANASIGKIAFGLVDRESIITETLADQLTLGRSTRRQRVRVYVGFEGLAWSDYTLVQTQLVNQIDFDKGLYKFSCADVQREMRKDLFEPAKTNLAQSLTASATTVEVVNTAAFALMTHGSSFSDAPNQTVGYIKIQSEIIRYTGKTSTQFTGCTRGALNTKAVEHAVDPGVASDRRTEVQEYVYLEMPAPKAVYALMTGGMPDAPIEDTVSANWDSSKWVAGQTPTNYSLNQNVAGESVFAVREGPDGYNEVVNVCQSLDTNVGDPGADGGWGMSQVIPINKDKSYLFACWFKRLSTGLNTSASAYWGLHSNSAGDVLNLNGTNNTNPYFVSSALPTMMPTADKWYLVVGFMHENTYGTTDMGISGVYDPDTFQRIFDGLEFKWQPDSTMTGHRAYHYYNQQISGEIQQMARPRIFPCTREQAPEMIKSLLSVAHRLPVAWHLGISPSYVRKADFLNKNDLYDWKDDRKGFITRFEGMAKTDGKKFIETELALLTGCFMPIYSNGALGFKRMSNVLSGAPYVKLLDDNNLVRVGQLIHDFDSLHNVLQISWNWELLKNDFTRVNLLIDSTSVDVHGQAEPLKFKFRGLHGSRHTATMLAQRFDAIRDRYTSPPVRIDVDVLPSLNVLEVGDVVRLKPSGVRDFVENGPLDRSFEIQNISINWITGDLTLNLFGSTKSPNAIPPTSDPTVISDAWYTSEGTNLASVLTISGSNPGHVTAGGTLIGVADLTDAAAIYYYDGDLEIDNGVTVNITNNVQLRVKGFLQNNGIINGRGNGIAGASQIAVTGPGQYNPGTPGFIGSPIAGGGIQHYPMFHELNVVSYPGATVTGLSNAVPSYNLNWDGILLDGLPRDLRGSSGSSGMPAEMKPVKFIGLSHGGSHYAGGAGGNGGAGLIIVSRGFAQGASGKIDLSGGNGSAGVVSPSTESLTGGSAAFNLFLHGGSGAGGAPGGLLVVLDGALTDATGLTDSGFVAEYGHTPITGVPRSSLHERPANEGEHVYSMFVGNGDGTTFPLPSLSGGRGGSRIQYVPASGDATPDLSVVSLQPPTNFGLSAGSSELLIMSDGHITTRVKATWTPALDSEVLAYDIQAKPSTEAVWTSIPTVFGQAENTAYFVVTKDGINWDVRIRSAGADRKVSNWVTISGFFVDGKSAPPSNVGTLSFTDPILSWSDISDADRRGYVVRYNAGASTDWNTALPAHVEGFITETSFDTGNIVGGITTFLVRAIDTSGNLSTTAANLQVDLRPAALTSFFISRQPDGTREFSWDTVSPPSDLDGIHIRYFLGTTADWNVMTPLHDGVLKASPFETNQLAAGTYTFAAKNVDRSGNESANATFITTVTIGDPRIAGAIDDFREEPVWSGTKTDCIVDLATGWLEADTNGTWTTLPATWAGWTQWNHDPKPTIVYTKLIDIGIKVKFIPLVTVNVDGTPVIEEQHSDDGISYSSYAVAGPQIDARYIRIRVTVTGTYPKIKTMRTILSASPVSEIVEDQDSSVLTGSYRIGVGDIRVPITKVYSLIKKVDISLQSVGAGWTWEVIDKDTSVGPRIKIYNASNVAADAVFDATVTGI